MSHRVIGWCNILLLCSAVATLLTLGQLYGDRYYTAWNDETLFIDIAGEYVSHGILGAPSYAGNGLRMDEKTYFMPPVYPLLLGGFFTMAPHHLSSARLFSNLTAAACLVGVFLLALSLRRRSLLAGGVVLALAFDTQFAIMYNWARPDMLAFTLGLCAVLLYYRGVSRSRGCAPARFAVAWTGAVAAMLTHPIAGLVGFVTIPVHALVTAPQIFRRRWFWIAFAGLPLVALSLWGLYVLDDVAAFKLQFFDWQSARKAARFDAAGAYLLAGGRVLINYGVKGAGILGLTSTVTLAVLLLKALREGSGPRPSLLVAILTLAGGVAVLFGREMAYPPLRLPAFYLGLFLCAESVTDIRSFPKLADVRGGVLRINYPVLFRTVFLAVFVLSVRSTTATLREVRTSPRAQAYDPKVLAARILAATDAGASIGVRLFPDCHDVLERSGHFGAVRKLSWHALNPAELTRYVCENRYLAMTETVLEPRFPGYLRNMTAPAWGGESYRRIAERYYRLHAVVELPGGGATKVYERSSVPAHGREATGCMAPVDGAEGGTAESR